MKNNTRRKYEEKKHKEIFQPIIASSLALALGIGVGNAVEPTTCTSSTNTPSICLDGGGDVSTGSGSTPNFGLTWNGSTVTTSNDTYQMINNNSTNGNFSFYLENKNDSNKRIV